MILGLRQPATVWFCAAFLALAGVAKATAPETSPRPKPRPATVSIASSDGLAPPVSPRPRHRPRAGFFAAKSETSKAVEQAVVEDGIREDQAAAVAATVVADGAITPASPWAVARSLRPKDWQV